MSDTTTILKGKWPVRVLERGPGQVVRTPVRTGPVSQRWSFLPCGHRAIINSYSAPFRYHRCERCSACYTTHPEGGWARIERPA